jgi:hypothetical protein
VDETILPGVPEFNDGTGFKHIDEQVSVTIIDGSDVPRLAVLITIGQRPLHQYQFADIAEYGFLVPGNNGDIAGFAIHVKSPMHMNRASE